MINQEKFFDGLNFEKVSIGEITCYKGPDGLFYKIDQGDTFIAIECADSEAEASHNLFDDAEMYDNDKPEGEMIEIIKACLKELAG